MPADCSQSALVGRWAGKRVLVQGDYAEDDDIPGWNGPPLSKLCTAMTPAEERSIDPELPKYWDNVPVFADISREACAFLEGACNVRYFEHRQVCKDAQGKVIDTWTNLHSVQVRPLARSYGSSGVAEYVISPDYKEEDLVFLKRMGMQPKDVMRPPRSGDWHGLQPHEIPEGQERVIVNLDTLEYVNPVKFGQLPTLAGMATLAPKDRDLPILKKAHKEWGSQIVDIAGGLFVMLCHPERRGGSDIPANATEMGGIDKQRAKYARLFKGVGNVKGRWRGGRILGTSEIRHEDWPTTEEVIERGTDISDKVLKYLVAISHY
jgi:hypothetical protein